jgi:hypothetical protein
MVTTEVEIALFLEDTFWDKSHPLAQPHAFEEPPTLPGTRTLNRSNCSIEKHYYECPSTP